MLRGALPPRLDVICYADDTLLVARGKDWSRAAILAKVGMTLLVDRIERLGLRVALRKTEAVWFHGPRRRPPPEYIHLSFRGVRVEAKPSIKYLGLILDSRWSFRPHFDHLSPKIMGAAASLGRLLPNLGGPRRLYMGVVRSMAMYGAPIWHRALTANKSSVAILRKAQKAVAVRAVRGYRTIAHEAACALAGTPP